MIEKIKIKGMEIGIKGLKDIFEVVKNMEISDEQKKKEILKRVKKENYIPESAEKDFEEGLWKEFRKWRGEEVPEEKLPFLEIKVIGAGCPRCNALFNLVKNVLAELNIEAGVNYIKDTKELVKYGVFITPVLVINEEVVLKGEVPGKKKIKNLLIKFKK